MKNLVYLILVIVSLFTNTTLIGQTDSLTNVSSPDLITIDKYLLSTANSKLFLETIPEKLNGKSTISINGSEKEISLSDGKALIEQSFTTKGELVFLSSPGEYKQLYHISQRSNGKLRVQKIPLWMSLIPPLIAIALALVFKEVISSLFIGIWSGAFIAGGMRMDSFYHFFLSIWSVFENYVTNALNDSGHIAIIVFSMTIGGMVAIISRNGGMAGVVLSLSKYAKSPTSAQFITWLLGVAIFFDDYANTLIVGNTMRSVTDQFKISREKLAYIVDSTAAPVAAIAFITTWIGAELGYIDDGIKNISNFEPGLTPYAIFISSLKYSFYPILALIFILIIIFTKRDFGPMYRAEVRARANGSEASNSDSSDENHEVEDLDPKEGIPLRWYNAFFPVITVILVTIIGLVDTGLASSYDQIIESGKILPNNSWGTVWSNIGMLSSESNPSFFMKLGTMIGNSDSYVALLWASISGVILAIIMTIAQRIMKITETINTMITGYKAMLTAIMILTLAWSLAATTEELYTAEFLTSALADSINPYFVPVLVFVLAAFISFSTGSSWSTMAILYPIAIPLTWYIAQSQGLEEGICLELLFNSIAVVLAASVLGDHCSPISDTTILSSLASNCNHISHVNTQLPYALTVGAVSIVNTGLSTFLGGGWLISFILLIVSVVILWLVVRRFGKQVD